MFQTSIFSVFLLYPLVIEMLQDIWGKRWLFRMFLFVFCCFVWLHSGHLEHKHVTLLPFIFDVFAPFSKGCSEESMWFFLLVFE